MKSVWGENTIRGHNGINQRPEMEGLNIWVPLNQTLTC